MTEAHALARRTDPSSSKVAARAHVAGPSASDKALVFELLRLGERFAHEQPRTAGELERWQRTPAGGANWAGAHRIFPSYLIRKRLNDLANEGRVERICIRKCEATGRPQLAWRTIRQAKLSLIDSIKPKRARQIRVARDELLDAMTTAAAALRTFGAVGVAERLDDLLLRSGRDPHDQEQQP